MGNQNSGRRPQPTALTVLRGNPSRKKLNENEVRPPSGAVVKPVMSPAAGVVWDELAPICLAMGTLTRADVRPFKTLCELESTMDSTSAQKAGRDLFTVKRESEDDPNFMTVVIDALLKQERETASALRHYYDLFGLTPVSRARIVVPKGKAEEPASKWAGVLK